MAGLVLCCSFAGAALGFFLRKHLPDSHLKDEPKDVIKQGFGLIATMVALVLGLLVASAKTEFDAQTTGFDQLSTNIILLDHTLQQYGPEAKPMREKLRETVAAIIEELWPTGAWFQPAMALDARPISREGGMLNVAIRGLKPKNDDQRALQTQALQIGADIAKTRWTLSLPQHPLLPKPFLVVLLFWLALLFCGYGLLTDHNHTVLATLVLCSISLAGAIFLIVELGEPLGGLIRVSSSSLRYALSQLGQ